MRSFILRILKSLKIKLVVKKVEVHSYLSYLRLDFIDRFDNYIVFEIFYNETDFFSDSLQLIGSSESNPYGFSDSIRSCCKLIGDHNDYKKFKKSVPTKEDLDLFFKTHMENLVDNLIRIDFGEHVKVKTIDFYLRPTLILMVQFNVKGKRVKPLKVFIGEKITYDYSSLGDDYVYVEKFIEKFSNAIYCSVN